jgi:hypothetical protein
MQVLIVDTDGESFVNKGQFPFVDPTTGVRFEPGVAVQVKSNAWIASQPVLEKQTKAKKG